MGVFEKQKFLHQFVMCEGGFLNKTWVYNCFIVCIKNEKTVRFLVRPDSVTVLVYVQKFITFDSFVGFQQIRYRWKA